MGRRLVWSKGSGNHPTDYHLETAIDVDEDNFEELEKLGFVFHCLIINRGQIDSKEVQDWCYENLKENWTDIGRTLVLFKNKNDAIRFRLVWG